MTPHSLLLRLIPPGTKVALVGAPDELAQAIQAASCEALAIADPRDDADARAALEAFRPAAVVIAAERPRETLGPLLAAVASAAPSADVVVSFWNGSASSVLLASLMGEAPRRPALTDGEVRAALSSAGYGVVAREAWSGAPRRTVADDVDAGLRRLLAQLNPAAADDCMAYRAARSGVAPVSRVPGLLSVVVRNHTTERLQLLDQTIFSLACQEHRPIEIVLVTQSVDPEATSTLTSLLERHRPIGEFAYRVLSVPSATDIRGKLVNVGIRAARGQYLAFLDDDDVVYPHHYRRLIAALREGSAAWAASRTRTARFTFDRLGDLYCTSKGFLSEHVRFTLADMVRVNFIPAHAFVLDRDRLGSFPIEFSEEVTRAEDYVLLLRLSTLFHPVFLPDAPSCEYRMRDDGSNTNLMATQPLEVRAREERAWKASHAFTEAMKKRLQVLMPLTEYEDLVRTGIPLVAPPAAGPPPLRYRFVDAINDRFKRLVPGAHGRAKALALRLGAGRKRR